MKIDVELTLTEYLRVQTLLKAAENPKDAEIIEKMQKAFKVSVENELFQEEREKQNDK